MTVMIVESKNDLNQSSYLTALDIYLIACFIFSLSSIFQFALVHYENRIIDEQDIFTIYRLISLNKRLLKKNKLRTKMTASVHSVESKSSSGASSKATIEKMTQPTPIKFSSQMDNDLSYEHLILHVTNLQKNMQTLEMRAASKILEEPETADSAKTLSLSDRQSSASPEPSVEAAIIANVVDPLENHACVASSYLNRIFVNLLMSKSLASLHTGKKDSNAKSNSYNRVSKFDYYARILYPLSFGLFNLIYWSFYLARRETGL
jgi:hypothetical protein